MKCDKCGNDKTWCVNAYENPSYWCDECGSLWGEETGWDAPAQLASMTKRAEATEAETAARMIAWLEGLEPDDMPDSATVLERLKRGDWRAVDICPTCRGVSGNGSGYCAAWHGGQHLDKTEVKP